MNGTKTSALKREKYDYKNMIFYKSPAVLLIFITLISIATEIFEITLVHFLPNFSFWVNKILEASLAVIVLVPLIYYLLLKPLIMLVDEHTRVEDQLEEERSKLLTLIDNLPNPIYVKNSFGEYVVVNDAAVELLNEVDRDAVIGMTDYDFYPPETAQKLYDTEQYLMKSGQSIMEKEQEMTDLSGNRKWCSVSKIPLKSREGKIIGLVAISHDITGHKKSEEAIKRSEARFRGLFENMNEAVTINEMVFDENGKAVDWIIKEANPAFQRINNIPVGESIGQPSSRLLGQNRMEYFLQFYAPTVETGKPINFEAFSPYDDKYFIISGFMLDDHEFATVITDITEHMEIEEELKRYTEELRRSKGLLEQRTQKLSQLNNKLERSQAELKQINAEKDKFFSVVAHDLKSPFQVLLSISQVLLDQFDSLDKKQIKHFVYRLNRSTKETQKFLDNLLNWSRLKTGRIEYLPDNVDLMESTLFVINLLQEEAAKKSIQILNDIKEVNYVYADQQMVHSIIENILSNAIKFTEPGGFIKIFSREAGNYTEIGIADNGIGISPSDLERFFKLDTTRTNSGTINERGTGLGLILCKEMVEKHGGYIRIESEENVGSVFYFTLPKQGYLSV